jgi:excisionase family DNA binding protein
MPLETLDDARMLSVSEVAELLGVSPYTVRRWIHLDHLRAVRLGVKRPYYRVSVTALRGFLASLDADRDQP